MNTIPKLLQVLVLLCLYICITVTITHSRSVCMNASVWTLWSNV